MSRLDTQGTGTTFSDLPSVPGTGVRAECGVSSTASTATEVLAVQECYDGSSDGTLRVVVLDPVRGRVVRQVATLERADSVPSLAVSADGRHVLLAQSWDTSWRDLRIDDGVVSQLPTGLQRLVW